MRVYHIIVFFLISKTSINAQELETILENLKNGTNSEVVVKTIDLDRDGDNDNIFIYTPAESKYFAVYLTVNNKPKKVLSEFGNISFKFEDSSGFYPSDLTVISELNHCCGESPFRSVREFLFEHNEPILKHNYVKYNHETYCEDTFYYVSTLKEIFYEPYEVKITKPSNVRFSADLMEHDATFVCIEGSNVIGQLKQNTKVTVLGEYKGDDSNLRTWLYVEVDKDDLILEACESPLSFDFQNQKLRAWISNKFTTILKE